MTHHVFDRAIDELARSQRGLVSRQQALDRGGTRNLIAERLNARRWVRLDDAVYALSSHPSSWEQRVLGSTLGERTAVTSGTTSAVIHRIDGFNRARPEIMVPPGNHHTSRLAHIRRSALIDPVVIEGIPTNSAALTLFELAVRFPTRIDAALESALRTRATSMDELIHWYGVLEKSRRPGLRLMRTLLEQRGGVGYIPSESELEARLYDVLDVPRLQPFVRQAPAPWDPTGTQRVDGLIERGRIIVEADSFIWHGGFDATKRDRRRDRRANRCGYECLRFYWHELKDEPHAVLDEVLAIQDERVRTLTS
jgi:very-short-patch-repair endonuclease